VTKQEKEPLPISRLTWVIIIAFVGALISSNGVLIADNAENKTRIQTQSEEIKEIKKDVTEIKKQTKILISIETGLGYVLKENVKSNALLYKISDNQQAFGLEQARRTNIVYGAKEHMADRSIHSIYGRNNE